MEQDQLDMLSKLPVFLQKYISPFGLEGLHYLDLRSSIQQFRVSEGLMYHMKFQVLPPSELRAKSFAEKIYPMRRYPGGGL
jgi:hypothetical protein